MPLALHSGIATPTTPLENSHPPAFRAQNIRNIRHSLDCFLYPIDQLDKLTLVLQQKNAFIVRFVVAQDGVLWFAEEGVPGSNIPAHYQMCSEHANDALCLTAGNVEFSHDYQQIIRVSHKSGDFRPSFESLAVFFSIFLKASRIDSITLPISLALDLQVNRLSSSNSIEEVCRFTMDDLETWCSSIKTIYPQPTQEKQIRYTKQHTTRYLGHMLYSPSNEDNSGRTSPPPAFGFD